MPHHAFLPCDLPPELAVLTELALDVPLDVEPCRRRVWKCSGRKPGTKPRIRG